MARSLLIAVVLCALPATHTAAQEDPKLLALQARKVLKQHCSRCHHGEGSEYRAFDVLNHATLLKDEADDSKAVVVPRQLDASLLWKRMGVRKSMPPRSVKERPSDADLDIVRRWIVAGAPNYPQAAARAFVSTEKLLGRLRDHLGKADRQDRRYLRFFTLHHLVNNPGVSDEDLRVVRAALAKAVNSLSWSPKIVAPVAIDPEQTILVVDVRDLKWDRHRLWDVVLRQYPYGLDYRGNDNLKKTAEDLHELTGGELVDVRADWFVATATRPPLYYDLLRLLKDVAGLERELKVDFEDNFARDQLARAGFAASGVSTQNRLVERHDSPVGSYYWKSYDFKPRQARANLFRFPLGPAFAGNDYARQGFEHAGGEMIFGLPNGLQAYFLSDGKGKRIDEGPTDVVSDALKTGGTPAIVNGTSCMHCHKHGTIGFTDTVRDGNALFGKPRDKVRRLYPEAKQMSALVRGDEERFVAALEKTVGKFLQVEEDAKRPIRDFSEPVEETVRAYLLADLTLATAAAELGIEKPETLAGRIRNNIKLKELGLLPLANGKSIKRDDWEARDGTSLFQDVATQLELGSPLRSR